MSIRNKVLHFSNCSKTDKKSDQKGLKMDTKVIKSLKHLKNTSYCVKNEQKLCYCQLLKKRQKSSKRANMAID